MWGFLGICWAPRPLSWRKRLAPVPLPALLSCSPLHKELQMPRITLSRRPLIADAVRGSRPTRRERREARQLFAQISTRPQNVRNELLEMASRSH